MNLQSLLQALRKMSELLKKSKVVKIDQSRKCLSALTEGFLRVPCICTV